MNERHPSFEAPNEESHPVSQSKADPFLADSWDRMVEGEHGEDQAEFKGRDYDAYMSIVTQIASVPEGKDKEVLNKLLANLKKGVSRYLNSISLLAERKVSEELFAIESADTSRKRAHTGIIDELNILSRAFERAGLDNSWRSDIGLTRKDATRWAAKISQVLLSELS